jgi:hypothetical protein
MARVSCGAVRAAALACTARDLSPVGTIMVVAADRRQARVILRYCLGLLRSVPMLAQLIESETRESIGLRNRVVIEVNTASFRSTRGYALIARLLDELAFWPGDDSAEPDYEVLSALRPGMATIPSSMLLCASSPYVRRGVLFDAHRKHFGKDGDSVLVWHAATRAMNPTVRQSVIDEAAERDPASAAAESGAEFRSDIESFVSRDAIEACVAADVRERAPVPEAYYTAFVDPSGGSADSFTLAVGPRQESVAVIDAVREVRPPFSPESVVPTSEVIRSRITPSRITPVLCSIDFLVVTLDHRQRKTETFEALVLLLHRDVHDEIILLRPVAFHVVVDLAPPPLQRKL